MTDRTPVSSRSDDATLVTSESAKIPHPLDTRWHVQINGQVYGPFSGHDLKEQAAEGRFEFDSLVQRVGGPDKWLQASEERSLKRFFIPESPQSPPKSPSVAAGGGAQVVNVTNTITAPAYIGEKPVDKSPWVAALLSLLIVGVGQMYNGQVGKGILMLIGCIFLWSIMLGWIVNLWSIVDAWSVASRKHDAFERWMEANAAAARAQHAA
ncbi:DUF4339 domain-containing protein [Marivita sp. GX14005]|uniref:DUF4339 domain-containing protein n=1 Tax=Marivita sp. GX14005 TaxID=2942276 RepID=UPI0020198C20|nr:DUF4339 domain-containing protein [Marivita sp. GX14005]MCL3882275.1 DUF4339 domain-containing protein [Marivita sp. GX14005]